MRISARSLLLGVAAVAVALAVALTAWRSIEVAAQRDADRVAAQDAQSRLGLLASELQKFRLLPVVLGENPDVAAALAGQPGGVDRLNRSLEELARATDAAVVYVIGRDGVTVAASNWRTPASFVGQSYAFRPYFRQAIRSGAAELFALGTVSRRPGLYLSRRVGRDGRILGVVVIKVEFDEVERSWRRGGGTSFVVDPGGAILVTSEPAWRFRIVPGGPGAPGRPAAGPRAPIVLAGPAATVDSGDGRPDRYRAAYVPAPLMGGTLVQLTPLDPYRGAARSRILLWFAAAILLLGSAALYARRAVERRRLQARTTEALEREVAARTGELRRANAQLRTESERRAELDARYREAREELGQASRLASIGQISAGVAHEINQPLAAIRTYAENGLKLSDGGRHEAARENLQRIVALTDRIGAITGELRAFSRRKTRATGRVTLAEAVDGLLLLLPAAARSRLVLDIPPRLLRMTVAGERIRLEQILVNLVQNAAEAVAGIEGGEVRMSAQARADAIDVVIADNGPGVSAAVRDSLFTPFATSKPEGLGLGLAIAREIAREFGGELVHVGERTDATLFRLTLVRRA